MSMLDYFILWLIYNYTTCECTYIQCHVHEHCTLVHGPLFNDTCMYTMHNTFDDHIIANIDSVMAYVVACIYMYMYQLQIGVVPDMHAIYIHACNPAVHLP